jgi:hypothetical protein
MHKKHIPVIFTLTVLLTLPGWLAADTASHRQAVEKLFELTFMQQKINASVDNVLALQIQQNPALREQEGELRSFLEKYIGWESLEDEITSMYLQTFTENELNDINDFYGSPSGRKLVQQIPELVKLRDGIAMQRLQEHVDELQRTLQAHAGK